MNPTKIEWCDFTWNPITGCLHNCEYCYARKIYKRFHLQWQMNEPNLKILTNAGPDFHDFRPTFWPSRLDAPAKRKKPARIFVVSMGDLFGEWVPDEWIEQVFAACEAAPQHTYYFLTKNPKRYEQYKMYLKNFNPFIKRWFFGFSLSDYKLPGLTILGHDIPSRIFAVPGMGYLREFVSVEPMMGQIKLPQQREYCPDWLIVGSETRNGKPVNMPKREWLLDIRQQCEELGIPLFEKNSLASLLPEGLIQEWPEEATK